MTNQLDKRLTDAHVDEHFDLLTKPLKEEREKIPEVPQEPRRPRMFRWLGWMLGIAIIAGLSWFAVDWATSDEPATATPTAVVTEPGAITADPKDRTPALTPATRTELIEQGQPGAVSLSEIVMYGTTPVVTVEDATVNPAIYWAPRDVPDPNTQFMEEATVFPGIYHQR